MKAWNCPYCGKEPVMRKMDCPHNISHFWLECCCSRGFKSGDYYEEEKAVRAWNDRVLYILDCMECEREEEGGIVTESIMKHTGRIIKELREKAGENQEQLAAALQVANRETVARWESGARDLKREHIIALAKHFNVSADYLLGLSEVASAEADTDYELKPCPFCGKPPITRVVALRETVAVDVSCHPCEIKQRVTIQQCDNFQKLEKAITAVVEKWNRRAEDGRID